MTRALAADAPWRTPGAMPRGLRAVVYGVLWSIVVTAVELLELPIDHLGVAQQLSIALDLLVVWCISGIGIAGIGLYAGARARGATLALMFVLLAATTSAIEFGVLRLARELRIPTGFDQLFPGGFQLWPGFLFNCWAVLCYGGIFMVALVLNVRADQTRRLLTQAQIARSGTATLYSEARLRALRGHVDPDFLLRVLGEVERRYAERRVDADGLLDLLVGFLRDAMPGLRRGTSTVAAEVALAAAYTELRAALAPPQVTWRFRVAALVPDLPFPPLLLLPILDALEAAAPANASGEIRLARDGDTVRLALDVSPAAAHDWLPAPLAYRLRVALGTMATAAWALTAGNGSVRGATALTLTGRRADGAACFAGAAASTDSIPRGDR